MSKRLLRTGFLIAAICVGCVGCQGTTNQGPITTDPGNVIGGTGAGGGTVTPECGGANFGAKMAPPGLVSPFTPQVGPTVTQPEAPPALSGGTLRMLRDGKTVVAADPDRDRVYVVDLPSRTVTWTIPLQHGDEPGRLTQDAAGRVHVALRRGGALVTINAATGTIAARRSVCGAPRGVAYDSATDLVHVACAGGELVSLPAADGAPVRTLKLDADLRDVVVDGSRLRVTRFRSAQLLTVDADGTVMGRMTPPAFRSNPTRSGQLFTPSTVWRALEAPAGGVVMLHQRGLVDEVVPSVGGYGGFDPCNAIVQTAVTVVDASGTPKSGPAMGGLVVAVDMAVSPDGQRVAIVAPGNSTNSETPGGPPRLPRLFVTDMQSATDELVGCQPDGMHGPCMSGVGSVTGTTVAPPPPMATGDTGTGGSTGGVPPQGGCGMDDPALPQVVGEPIAVVFDPAGHVIVQSREPAMLELTGGQSITLSTDSRLDTGHTLFHANAGGFMACASCHAEGTEDGRVWNFACEGKRRTQSLQTGLRGTEPFHWGGDERDFSQLVTDVFQGRMSGPQLQTDQVDATLSWIDGQPRMTKSPVTDAAAVERGRALFNDSTRAACATCHNGARLTNNKSVDVGTGGVFQVPSLVGVANRAPYMHNGCAPTLRDRFSAACGGGDKHGVTSMLTAAQIGDLVAYLETL